MTWPIRDGAVTIHASRAARATSGMASATVRRDPVDASGVHVDAVVPRVVLASDEAEGVRQQLEHEPVGELDRVDGGGEAGCVTRRAVRPAEAYEGFVIAKISNVATRQMATSVGALLGLSMTEAAIPAAPRASAA